MMVPIHASERLLVLTGAGVSAESGVPTFRGGGGAAVWRGMPFEQLSSARMVNEDLPLVWEWFDYRRGLIAECSPNDAHLAIAKAEESGHWKQFSLVTQNIDGLHRLAGSKEIIELHGHINDARCLSCGLVRSLRSLPNETRPPECIECGAAMRPNVVLFGETLEENDLTTAYEKAAVCDVCIVVGTSAVVYPANIIPRIAKREGAFLIEVNPEETELTSLADESFRDTACKILPHLLDLTS